MQSFWPGPKSLWLLSLLSGSCHSLNEFYFGGAKEGVPWISLWKKPAEAPTTFWVPRSRSPWQGFEGSHLFERWLQESLEGHGEGDEEGKTGSKTVLSGWFPLWALELDLPGRQGEPGEPYPTWWRARELGIGMLPDAGNPSALLLVGSAGRVDSRGRTKTWEKNAGAGRWESGQCVNMVRLGEGGKIEQRICSTNPQPRD